MQFLTPDLQASLDERFSEIWRHVKWPVIANAPQDETDGLHARQRKSSPSPGIHSQFREYKPYEPGDELKQIDWKRYARTDRLYVKQYESQVRRRFKFSIDLSPSMFFDGFGVSGTQVATSKARLACEIAIGMSYLSLAQRDSVQLLSFDVVQKAVTLSQPQLDIQQLDQVLFEWTRTSSRNPSSHKNEIGKPADIHIVISDFLPSEDQTPDSYLNSLNDLILTSQSPLLLCHLLHPEEVRLPDQLLAQATSLKLNKNARETSAQILAGRPAVIRKRHLERIRLLMQSCEDWAREKNASYLPLFELAQQAEPWPTLFKYLSAF